MKASAFFAMMALRLCMLSVTVNSPTLSPETSRPTRCCGGAILHVVLHVGGMANVTGVPAHRLPAVFQSGQR